MSNKAKKKTIWNHLNWIIPGVIGLLPGHYLYRDYINPAVENNNEEALVPAQIISSDNSESLHRQCYPNHAPSTMEETQERKIVGGW